MQWQSYDELEAEIAALRARVAELEAAHIRRVAVLDSPELLEALAASEHERWAGWMEYQSRAPAEKVADWPRKVAIPYSGLTNIEQESDRIEARKTLAIIKAALTY